MNRTIIIFCLLAFSSVQAQSLSQQVIASSGEYVTGTNFDISWTLGEIATETFNNGNYTITQGFQQPVTGVVISGINLDLLVYIEGPFTGTLMSTFLNAGGQLPLGQPYNTSPWNYPGNETVLAIPNANVVDWVLIELRDAASAALATSATRIARQAAFLLKDGSVAGIDGSSILHFNNSFAQQLFVVVWHRNHLGIIAATGFTETGGVYNYDFSLSSAKVLGGNSGYKNLGNGIWGLASGDATQDGSINQSDRIQWISMAGKKGYLNADFNVNVQVNNLDKNDYWLPNRALSSQIPQ